MFWSRGVEFCPRRATILLSLAPTNKTNLKQLIKVLLVGILETSRPAWDKLKLNSAGQWPSGQSLDTPVLENG